MFIDWLKHLIKYNIYPVGCVVYPMCCNRHLEVRINYHNVNMFHSLTRRINDSTVTESRDIIEINVSNNFITPYMPRKVYTRRRGVYASTDQFVTDGLH